MEAPRDVPSKASRPVLSGYGRSLPASSPCASPLFTRSRSDQPDVPGHLNRFHCSRKLASPKCVRFSAFHASCAVRTSCTWLYHDVHPAFAGSLPARLDS